MPGLNGTRKAVVICGLAVLSACSAALPVPAQTSESVSSRIPVSYPLTSVVISLERSVGSEGPSPAYRVDLHGDGRIVYYGYAYVAEAGQREASVDPQEIVNLLSHLYEIRFFDMPYEFSSLRLTQYRDGTITALGNAFSGGYPAIVSVRVGDYEKRMLVRASSPEEFGALPQMIDDLAGTERWVR